MRWLDGRNGEKSARRRKQSARKNDKWRFVIRLPKSQFRTTESNKTNRSLPLIDF